MSKLNCDFICFTTLPKLCDLLYIHAVIDKLEKNKISTYNSVILKCRQLIFENDELIAYPELIDNYAVIIVTTETFYSNNISICLKKYNLRSTGGPLALTRYIYERSCYYTILTKIAPKWNNISNYFVYGREFLSNPSPTDCVFMNIHITEESQANFHFQTHRVKLPEMDLNKLDLPFKYIQDLREHKYVKLEKCDQKYVRVLPSLKKGLVTGVSSSVEVRGKAIGSGLRSYKYMRRHWKNTYGYRLPEDDSGLVYFDIEFFDGSPSFTYPNVCVRPYEPVFLKRTDPLTVVESFLAELAHAVPLLLGQPYPPPAHIGYPSVSFTTPTQELNRINTIQPTPGNHFDPNKLLPQTQKFTFGSRSTQIQSGQTQMKGDHNESVISQFVQELEEFADEEPATNKITIFRPGGEEQVGRTKPQEKYVPIFERNKINKNLLAGYQTCLQNSTSEPNNRNSSFKNDKSNETARPELQENSENKRKMEKQPKNEKRAMTVPSTEEMLSRCQAGAVDKLTAPVLLAFLRQSGAPCRASDRKAELVNKVINLFNNNL